MKNVQHNCSNVIYTYVVRKCSTNSSYKCIDYVNVWGYVWKLSDFEVAENFYEDISLRYKYILRMETDYMYFPNVVNWLALVFIYWI
jgi:hypothetical protein